MKKITLLIFGLFLLSTSVYADTSENPRNQEINIYLGTGLGFPNIKIPAGVSITPKSGLAFGASWLSYHKKRWATGIEFFSQQGDYSVNDKSKALGATSFNFNLANKYVFGNMDQKLTGYIPFGVGFGFVEVRKNGPVPPVQEKNKSNGFTWFLGLGGDYDIGEETFMGLEGRITQNFFDKEQTQTLKGYFWSASIVLKFGMRF